MKLNLAYNRDEFVNFLKNDFLPDFQEDIRPIDQQSAIHTIKGANYLGRSDTLDIQIFELKTGGKSSKKISQAIDSFKILREYQAYRALIAYYSEDDSNWRFALLQMTPDLTDKGRLINRSSNPRRFSFLLGPDAQVKTPERYLSDKVKDLPDLLERFNVEVVTKEFFDNYKKLFESLLKYFENDHGFKVFASRNGIKLEIFTKKILGQIVFIYFLQKKGWLGAKKGEHISKGDKTFLRTIFDRCQENKQSFFNEYLEYLFYDCLNKKPEMAGSFYRNKFECQIPFLNGGLFEPVNSYKWQDEFVYIPNEIFSNIQKTGILDIFDLYNFTIDENTPDDQEVSVDPEMLGKVFENLIEDNIRKGRGAFYTPREIVQYMCQESLISFLSATTQIKDVRPLLEFFNLDRPRQLNISPELANQINIALENIKVVDPACGSGAFLIGMLQLIVQVRSMMCFIANVKTSEYKLKKQTIENCIYGVDIDPGAVDIAKLRFWLSIVVDEDIDEIEPLPNLDYKIMQGNSLLENLVIGDSQIVFNFDGAKKIDKRTREMKNLFEVQTQTKLFFDKSETLTELLEKLHAEFFNASEHDKKRILKRKIDNIEDELIKSKCQEEIANAESQIKNSPNDSKKTLKNTEKILAIKELLNKWEKDHLRPFFPWKLHFGEVFNCENSGFDIVIANPPYIKEYTQKSAFDGLRKSPYYQGKMDIWYLFTCKGIDMARNRTGVVAFIAQNNWVTSYGASKMRNKIIKDTQILSLIDFGDYKIFNSAGIQTMVMLFEKNHSKLSYNFDFRRLFGHDIKFDNVLSILNKTTDDHSEYLEPLIDRSNLLDKNLTFGNSEVEGVLSKIVDNSNFRLDPIKEVAQGIVCPQDSLNRASQESLGERFRIGDGVFVLTEDELDKLAPSEREKKIIKPYFTTRELHKWYGENSNKRWILYTDSSFKNSVKINDYPNIKKHLDQFSKIITSDNKPYGLHRARNNYFFQGEKIIGLRKCSLPTFTYTDFDSYVSETFYVIKTSRVDIKYLLGLLNSKLIAFWLRNKGKMQGNNFQIDKEPIVDLPLLESSENKTRSVVNLVNSILDHKKNNIDTSLDEDRLDIIIYDLYNLTSEEIKIIEDSVK